MHLVLGASGRAGGDTARALIDQGAPVRVLLRRPEQAAAWLALGAEVAIGSIEDGPSLVAAMRGVTSAFLLSPPPTSGDPFRSAEEVGGALADAVRQADLPRLVALSSVGAQHETGTGVIAMLNILERHLRDSASAVTILRPGYYVEAWSEVATAAMEGGVLPTFLEPSQRIPMVSTVDVGRTAASLLLEDSAGLRIIELGGPEDWSADDVAAAFGIVLGRPVDAAFVPLDERPAILAGEGVPTDVATALLGMYDGIASGRVAREEGTDHRRGVTGLVEAVERIVRTCGHLAA